MLDPMRLHASRRNDRKARKNSAITNSGSAYQSPSLVNLQICIIKFSLASSVYATDCYALVLNLASFWTNVQCKHAG